MRRASSVGCIAAGGGGPVEMLFDDGLRVRRALVLPVEVVRVHYTKSTADAPRDMV